MARPTHYEEKATRAEKVLRWRLEAIKDAQKAEWLGLSPQAFYQRKKRGLNLTYKEAIILITHLDELEQEAVK